MFGFMVMVRLPGDVLSMDTSDSLSAEKHSYTDGDAEKMQDILHYDFKVEVCSTYMYGHTTSILKCFYTWGCM